MEGEVKRVDKREAGTLIAVQPWKKEAEEIGID
jgi:hypothetical protein